MEPALKTIDKAVIIQAKARLRKIETALISHSTQKNGLPDDLYELLDSGSLEGGEASLMDPWKNDILYEKLSAASFVLTSSGPDGELGTEDDIEIRRER